VTNDMYPKVSVITITMNSAATLEKTLQSVLNQRYPSLEYIVIDGGSTDGTVEIIKKYAPELAYWISEPDDGIADAWNKGIRRASGDIVHILNSDDWHDSDTIKHAVDFLSNTEMCGFVFGNLFKEEWDGGQRLILGDPAYAEKIRCQFPRILHPTVFIRHDVYRKYGLYDINYKVACDYEYLLRLSLNNIKGGYCPKLYCFMGDEGVSARNYILSHREVMNISIKYGYPRWKAWLRFLRNIIQSSILRGLVQLKIYWIIRWVRQLMGE